MERQFFVPRGARLTAPGSCCAVKGSIESLQVSLLPGAPRQRPFETSPGSGLCACGCSRRRHNGRATQRATPPPPRPRALPSGGVRGGGRRVSLSCGRPPAPRLPTSPASLLPQRRASPASPSPASPRSPASRASRRPRVIAPLKPRPAWWRPERSHPAPGAAVRPAGLQLLFNLIKTSPAPGELLRPARRPAGGAGPTLCGKPRPAPRPPGPEQGQRPPCLREAKRGQQS